MFGVKVIQFIHPYYTRHFYRQFILLASGVFSISFLNICSVLCGNRRDNMILRGKIQDILFLDFRNKNKVAMYNVFGLYFR